VIVALVPDLADRSRIEAAVGGVTFVRSLAEVGEPDVLIVDLSRLDGLPSTGAKRVIGFGSHVDAETLDRARAAGIEAMPRSRFFRDIAAVLS
jgi:hypothetical protein